MFGARQNSHSHSQPHRCDRGALEGGPRPPPELKNLKSAQSGQERAQKVFWAQRAKVSQESFAPPKPCFAPVQLSFAPVPEDFGALGPKDLLHPPPTTLSTFEVLGPCSRHLGTQLQNANYIYTVVSASLVYGPIMEVVFETGPYPQYGWHFPDEIPF